MAINTVVTTLIILFFWFVNIQLIKKIIPEASPGEIRYWSKVYFLSFAIMNIVYMIAVK